MPPIVLGTPSRLVSDTVRLAYRMLKSQTSTSAKVETQQSTATSAWDIVTRFAASSTRFLLSSHGEVEYIRNLEAFIDDQRHSSKENSQVSRKRPREDNILHDL